MNIAVRILYFLKVDLMADKFSRVMSSMRVKRLSEKYNTNIKFISQGEGGLIIAGDKNKFYIDQTSHLKSGTLIECAGGVTIGRYFHPGRGLTIFSSNHNYDSDKAIPYDETDVYRPVVIKDFVWCGANVTIVPGVTIGEGVVIGSGAVITKDVPDYAIVGGSPAKVIKYRDVEKFLKLKAESKFY